MWRKNRFHLPIHTACNINNHQHSRARARLKCGTGLVLWGAPPLTNTPMAVGNDSISWGEMRHDIPW